MEDLYAVLGVVSSSTTEQIIAEYRAKALQLHPDKTDSATESEQFKLLSVAKNVLTDPQERKLYDQWYNSGKIMGVTFDQWKHLKMHTSLHWATTVDRTPMVDSPEAAHTDSGGQQSGNVHTVDDVAAYWRSTQSKDAVPAGSLLSKFRNYEI
uniref:J domain-containing protein n=1 Tax=Macrostomum lignano TaxID=282301 RepID=A0A1I8H416_9PLAT